MSGATEDFQCLGVIDVLEALTVDLEYLIAPLQADVLSL